MNNQPKQLTVDEIVALLKKGNVKNVELMQFFESLKNPNMVYVITKKAGRKFIGSLFTDPELKKKFWQLYEKGQEINAHNNTVAKLGDVDRAVSNAYTLLVQMIGTLNNTQVDTSNMVEQICKAINDIEDHLGIPKTEFQTELMNNEYTEQIEQQEIEKKENN